MDNNLCLPSSHHTLGMMKNELSFLEQRGEKSPLILVEYEHLLDLLADEIKLRKEKLQVAHLLKSVPDPFADNGS